MPESKFIPYRCEDCIHGIYNAQDSCWDDGCGAETDEECQKLYEDDERC